MTISYNTDKLYPLSIYLKNSIAGAFANTKRSPKLRKVIKNMQHSSKIETYKLRKNKDYNETIFLLPGKSFSWQQTCKFLVSMAF